MARKIGYLPGFLIIAGFLILLSKFTSYVNTRSRERIRLEQQRIIAQEEKKKENDFTKSIESHYNSLVDHFGKNKLSLASTELDLFKKYNKLDYKDVSTYYRKVRIFNLEQQVKKIPVSKFDYNLRIYEQLLNLNPASSKYKNKIAFYKAKIEKQKKIQKRKKRERQERIAKFGEAPTNSAWDGSVYCVELYLKKVAKDPDSLVFEKWSEVYSSNDGWIVLCQYRAKNSFGGYVRNINWFVISHNNVIAIKDSNAYQ